MAAAWHGLAPPLKRVTLMAPTGPDEHEYPAWRAVFENRLEAVENSVAKGFTRLETRLESMDSKLSQYQGLDWRIGQLEKVPEKSRGLFQDAIGTGNCLIQAAIALFAGLSFLVGTAALIVTILLHH